MIVAEGNPWQDFGEAGAVDLEDVEILAGVATRVDISSIRAHGDGFGKAAGFNRADIGDLFPVDLQYVDEPIGMVKELRWVRGFAVLDRDEGE